MFEIFQYDFIQNAIISAILVSFISGIVGSLILVNKMTFLAGGIAHSSYGGVGLAIFLSIPIFLGASIFAILSAIVISLLIFKDKEMIDAYIGIMWAVGMAIGVILIDLTPGYNKDLMSYLFGSILAVTKEDIYYMAILLILLLLFIHIFYPQILAVSYDFEYAQIKGIKAKLFFSSILIFSALAIVASIKVVGLILIIALMSIPTYIAKKLTSSLYSMMITSGLISVIFSLIGLFISYTFNLTAGATIILISAIFLALFILIKK